VAAVGEGEEGEEGGFHMTRKTPRGRPDSLPGGAWAAAMGSHGCLGDGVDRGGERVV
jgi:hypothetical protein